MEKIKVENDTQTYWLGMSDYEINLPMVHKIIRLVYISEPSHMYMIYKNNENTKQNVKRQQNIIVNFLKN